MKNFITLLFPVALAAVLFGWPAETPADNPEASPPAWDVKAELVHATSDEGFCDPHDIAAKESDNHKCKFFCAIRILNGHYRDTNLAGARVVLAGDYGLGLEGIAMNSLVVTYDPSVTPEQKLALADILRKLIPLKWVKTSEVVAGISWETRDDGLEVRIEKKGQLIFTPDKDAKGDPVVKQTLGWWNASRTEDMHVGRATFGFKSGDMDLNFSGARAYTTRIEGKGTLDAVQPQNPPAVEVGPPAEKK